MTSRNDIVRTELPSELQALLISLRQRLRRYSLRSGVLGLIIAAGVTFWATTGLDTAWFALQRLELPVGLRAVLLVVMLAGVIWLLWRGVAVPYLRRVHDRDLALLLEHRFPEYQDRLITAVESAQGMAVNGPLASDMLTRTVTDADNLSQNKNPDDVFDPAPLRQRGWIAGILLLSVAGLGAAAPETLPRWWNAFVRCDTVYRQRTTHLDVQVIQQPGDRRLPFRIHDDQPLYLHPRGNDLELELTIPAGTGPTGKPWVVPERVRVDVRRADGTTSRTYVSPTSDRTFRYVITRLQDDVEIELLAGDFRIPQPLIVQSVAPPALDGITLQCDFPEYTRWNQLRATTLEVTGSETSIPVGTRFRLAAQASKPLQAVRVTTDAFEISGTTESSRIDFRNGMPPVDGPGLLSPDGLVIGADFELIPEASPNDSAEAEPTDAPAYIAEGGVLQIPPGTSFRFSLHDQDDVVSGRLLLFRVQGIVDRPPAIDVHADALDRAVTRRAVIPYSGSIRDDYGLRSAGFEFIVDDETQWRPRPFSIPMAKDTTNLKIRHRSSDSSGEPKPELFQVQPLDLTEGQTLSIALTATDGCTIGGTNTTRSDPDVYRVVSDEELLALLYTREINLRRRFEESLREIQQVREDLGFHEQVAKRIEAAGDQAKAEDHAGLTTSATRSGNTLRRQTNELKSILLGFEGIIRQLINNAVPLGQSDTMKNNIATPLQKVILNELPSADRAVSRLRVAATSRTPTVELVKESEHQVGEVIARLTTILELVRNMAEFHEVVSGLRALQEDQKRIQKDTKRLKRQRLIDEL